MGQNLIRKPAVAGRFYPKNAAELRKSAEEYIENAGVQAVPEQVVTIIAPHAGYVYSGPTAGFAYARVRGKHPGRVILIGCSHRYSIETASVFNRGAFETPLGTFPVDEAFADAVAAETYSETVEPHLLEHSLEVQLPLLSVALGEVPIVPVLFGALPRAWHAEVGRKLAGMVDDGDLLVASTDLSHYLTEEEAHRLDKFSVDTVLAKDWQTFSERISEGTCSMCGASAVVAAMAFALARHAEDWTLLDYRTSAAVSGDHDRVVGYAAMSMERAA